MTNPHFFDITMQYFRNLQNNWGHLIPADWRASYRQFIQISYFLYSLPFTWIEWVDGGRLGITKKQHRLLIIFCMLIIASLDCIYRSLVCVYVDYGSLTSDQVLQMYLDYISRIGATVSGWAVFFGSKGFMGLANNLLMEDERVSGTANLVKLM